MFFQVDKPESNFDSLNFESGKEVKFLITDVKEDMTKGKLDVHCIVMSGEHVSKNHTFFIWSNFAYNKASDGVIRMRKRETYNFLFMFYGAAFIKEGFELIPSELISREFVATPKETKGKDGRTFKNFINFQQISVASDQPSSGADKAASPMVGDIPPLN